MLEVSEKCVKRSLFRKSRAAFGHLKIESLDFLYYFVFF